MGRNFSSKKHAILNLLESKRIGAKRDYPLLKIAAMFENWNSQFLVSQVLESNSDLTVVDIHSFLEALANINIARNQKRQRLIEDFDVDAKSFYQSSTY